MNEDDNDDDDPTWIDRQVEEPPLPNPPIPNGTETFSACLLVMVRTIVHLYIYLFVHLVLRPVRSFVCLFSQKGGRSRRRRGPSRSRYPSWPFPFSFVTFH